MADNNTVARPYAQAVFEVAQENKALAELAESFAAARELMADGQIAAFLTRPKLSDEDRLSFLQGLYFNGLLVYFIPFSPSYFRCKINSIF